MQVTTRTATVHHHFIDIDGVEYGTTFQAVEYIEPKVETEGNKTVLTYATRDDYPFNPRDTYSAGTMVRVRDGYNGIDIDQPDSDIEAAFKVADDLIRYGDEFGVCGDYDLDREGIAAMFTTWQENGFADEYELLKAYVAEARKDITALIGWSITGYSQGDWAEGYAYTTITDFEDPEAALKAEVAEYDAWAKGDTYLLVEETYIDNEQTDYDCVGGYYGDDAIEAAIKEGI